MCLLLGLKQSLQGKSQQCGFTMIPFGRLNESQATNLRSLDQHRALVNAVSAYCSSSKLG